MKKVLVMMVAAVMIFATPMAALAAEEVGQELLANEVQAEDGDIATENEEDAVVDSEDVHGEDADSEDVDSEDVDSEDVTTEGDNDKPVVEKPTCDGYQIEEGSQGEAEANPTKEPQADSEVEPDGETIEDMSSLARDAKVQRNSSNVYNVTDYGANGNDKNGDAAAIRKVLDLNKNENINDTSKAIVVVIPAGTYYLENSLNVYSNTTIKADKNAKFIRTNLDKKMIFGFGQYGKLQVGGYNCFKNITIEGGTWDGNDLKGKYHEGIALFRHGQGVTFRNMTFINSVDHFINISASKDILFEGVTFKNSIEYKGTDKSFWGKKDKKTRFNGIEAIHMDTASKIGESSAHPLDNTACANITVRNCTFDKVFSGAGNHHVNPGYPTKNVTIENNTFRNLLYAPVIAWGFENLTVRNNTAVNVNAFMETNDSTGKIINNSVKGKANQFVSGSKLKEISRIQLYDGCSFTISDNTIEGGHVSGIAVFIGNGKTKRCTATISNNTISGVANNGIYVKEAKNVKITNNKIKNSKNQGILVKDSTNSTIKNNTITKSGNCGIYVDACQTAKVEANVVKDSKLQGIVVSNNLGSKKTSTKITITKNEISGKKGRWDINIQKKSKGTMKSNKVSSLSRINIESGCKFKSSNNVTKSTFTVKYNGNGGKGKMSNTTVTYSKKTSLRANQYKKSGSKFMGWHASRSSDKKWAYTDGKKTVWYEEGKQPASYKLKVYKNKANVAKITKVHQDVVTMKAIWE